MKKLLLKGILLIGIVLAFNHMLKIVVIDNYYWGNEKGSIKLKHLKENNIAFNTLFFGSSTTARNMDPKVFSENVKKKYRINAFNMGSLGTVPPESYVILEKVLKDRDIKLNYVFLELSNYDRLFDENLETVRKKYFYSPSSFLSTISGIWQMKQTKNYRLRSIRNHSIVFLKNVFHFGIMMQYFSHEEEEEVNYREDRFSALGDNKDGFVPAKKSVRDTTNFGKHITQTNRAFNKNTGSGKVNTVHMKKVKKLLKLAEENNVYLIFVLQPKFGYVAYSEIIPIFEQIDEYHKINMADPDKFPELYYAKYSKDKTHLNHNGAKIYSRYLAKEFNDLMNKIKRNEIRGSSKKKMWNV